MSRFWKPGSEKPSTLLVDDEEGGVVFLLHSQLGLLLRVRARTLNPHSSPSRLTLAILLF